MILLNRLYARSASPRSTLTVIPRAPKGVDVADVVVASDDVDAPARRSVRATARWDAVLARVDASTRAATAPMRSKIIDDDPREVWCQRVRTRAMLRGDGVSSDARLVVRARARSNE